MPYGFTYLLVTPTVSRTTGRIRHRDPNWKADEILTLGDGRRLRIVPINLELDDDSLEELYEQGINGMCVVEPV